MRYLDIEELNALNTMFNQFEPEDGTRFLARAEAYSCICLILIDRQSRR